MRDGRSSVGSNARRARLGSGAPVARPRQLLLHVDVGGGTTKLALIDRGTILSVSAFAVGGRLLAQTRTARGRASTTRPSSPRRTSNSTSTRPRPPTRVVRDAIAARLAHVLIDYVTDTPRDALGSALLLTERPRAQPRSRPPCRFRAASPNIFSAANTADYGDIARAVVGPRSEGVAEHGWRCRRSIRASAFAPP